MVTVGSIQGGSTHNIIGSDVTMLLTVRSFTPEVRKLLLDGIARIAKGEAIAAGVPDDRMPDRHGAQTKFTPGDLQHPAAHRAGSRRCGPARFGQERVVETPRSDGRRGFRPLLARRQVDPEHDLLGRRRAAGQMGRGGQGGQARLPSLHSAYWAPDAEAVIGTATEAMTAAALDILKK